MSATWRGIVLILRAAPVAAPTMFLIDAVQGLAPSVVFGASAVLLDQAPHLRASHSAAGAVALALGVIAAALVVQRTSQATVMMLDNLVTFKTEAAVDEMRMRAAAALPGLGHFDRPAIADKLAAAQWATAVSRLPNDLGYLIRWTWTAIGSSVIASRIAWWAPVLLVGVSLPFIVLNRRRLNWLGRAHLETVERQRVSGYFASLGFTSAPAREVRLFGLEQWVRDRQRTSWETAMRPVFAAQRAHLVRDASLAIPRLLISMIPFVVALSRLVGHAISIGTFAAGVMAMVAIAVELPTIEQLVGQLRDSTRYLPQLFELAALPSREPGLVASGRRTIPSRLAQGIRFEGIRFTYPSADHPVLDELDLFVPAGSSLALVGENGAGKSTVVKLLCRFYDPDCGRITFDGVDLRDIDIDCLRRRLAVLVQDLTPLPLSVADNIRVGAIACSDPALLSDAAALSGAAEVIDRLPNGWDTVLAKDLGGSELSGGEWQRVALARTILARKARNTPMVILDEPTAAVDVRLEHELRGRIASLARGVTTVLVSHRLATVRICDRIAVLSDGRITEAGTHAELIQRRGRYAELYDLQARHFSTSARRE